MGARMNGADFTSPRGHRGVAMLTDVKAERLDLAAVLEQLDEHEWRAPSLCPGWTVRDVVAHLTLSTRQPIGRTNVHGNDLSPAPPDHNQDARISPPPPGTLARGGRKK